MPTTEESNKRRAFGTCTATMEQPSLPHPHHTHNGFAIVFESIARLQLDFDLAIAAPYLFLR